MITDKNSWEYKNYDKYITTRRKWQDENRDKLNAQAREQKRLNPEKVKLSRKQSRENKRLRVLSHYSGGTPKCACCGEKNIKFLTIDHIHGGGTKHLKSLKSPDILYWIETNNYPEGFQILCYNCNCGRARNDGVCPHDLKSAG